MSYQETGSTSPVNTIENQRAHTDALPNSLNSEAIKELNQITEGLPRYETTIFPAGPIKKADPNDPMFQFEKTMSEAWKKPFGNTSQEIALEKGRRLSLLIWNPQLVKGELGEYRQHIVGLPYVEMALQWAREEGSDFPKLTEEIYHKLTNYSGLIQFTDDYGTTAQEKANLARLQLSQWADQNSETEVAGKIHLLIVQGGLRMTPTEREMEAAAEWSYNHTDADEEGLSQRILKTIHIQQQLAVDRVKNIKRKKK